MSAPLWKPLVTQALVGCQRQPSPWQPPTALGHAASGLVQAAQDSADQAAQALLRGAAVLAAMNQCAPPLVAQEAPDSVPPCSPDPAEMACSPAWLKALGDIWLADDLRLVNEACQTLDRACLRLPAQMLVASLEIARRQTVLRPALRRVMGTRGAWLARQRPQWAALATDPVLSETSHWLHGNLAERQLFLQSERESQPAAARARLQAALPEMAAKERAELLGVLRVNLGPDDEPLLDTLMREDRSKDVRQEAAELLMCLPVSAFCARAVARVRPLMSTRPDGSWVLTPPMAADPAWKADLLDTDKPRHERVGERAWWLQQIVRQVPLSWWPSHTGMDIPSLVSWATAGPWEEVMLRAWREQAHRQGDPGWCLALLLHPTRRELNTDTTLFQHLDPLQQEQLLMQRCQAVQGTDRLNTLTLWLSQWPWHRKLSSELSTWLIRETLPSALDLDMPVRDSHLRSSVMQLLGVCCHPDALLPLQQALSPLQADMPRTDLARTLHLIDLRQQLARLAS